MPGAWAALVIVAAFVLSGLKVLREYERAVVFRLGRLVGARGPGVIYVIPGIEKALRIDLRTITMDIPSQDVITKDEFQAANRLAEASAIMAKEPIALQLRYLQTLVEIASENNSTTIFPVPIDLLKPFLGNLGGRTT